VIGVNGTVGQGKSVFSQAIVSRLNALVKPDEGQAITRSLDDYYLTKAERSRPQFADQGYCPTGISNRGPAGTHDMTRLWNDIQAMELSHTSNEPAIIDLPSFDKQADDRAAKPYRVYGKVGVFILEGWFVGANTDVDPKKIDPGLKRSVAKALSKYKPIFNRLDALWAFEPPASTNEIIAQRMEQEQTLLKGTGRAGLSLEQISRMVKYFYEDSWQDGLTSPFPPKDAISFLAKTDLKHQFIKTQPSLGH
jgi:pantothenate kinase-related protein Tda10